MKYLFFLLVIPFLLIPSAYAEVGRNFDTEQLPNGFVKWTSHYERVLDGWSWVNYKLVDDSEKTRFESSGIIFEYDKNTCDFKLYNIETGELSIPSYVVDLSIDGIPIPNVSCNLADLIVNEDTVTFTIEKTGYKVFYVLDAVGMMEWTYETDVNTGLAKTYSFVETCINCKDTPINGTIINFGDYILDTKNDSHGTVVEAKPFPCTAPKDLFCPTDVHDFKLTYEKIVADNEKLIIDPTFTSNNPTEDAQLADSDNDNNCEAVPGSIVFDGASGQVGRFGTATTTDCDRFYSEWDISIIPDTSTVDSVTFNFDITLIAGTPATCDYVGMSGQPTVETDATNWANIGSGTVLVSADTNCQSAGDNKILGLGSAGKTYIQNQLVSDWAAIGVKATGDVGALDATNHITNFCHEEAACTPDPTLIIVYDSSDAVDDLTATDIRGTAVDLDWTTPASPLTITGYQVNRTTPWSQAVNTVVINDTGSTTTAYTATGLTGETQYSFRVGVWAPPGFNHSGNVLNITTTFDPTGSFTPGTFDLNATGTDDRPIVFTRNDIDDTSLFLNITVDQDWDLACNFHYKFANINKTYTNIANTSVDSETDAVGFQFNDIDNEIVDVRCWDQDTDETGRYIITQTVFPFLQEIQNFRAGDYGTEGIFGVIDIVTLMVVIIGMVGFNRADETVGGVFLLFIVGGLAVFEIVAWPTVMTAGIVLAMVVIIGSRRKD